MHGVVLEGLLGLARMEQPFRWAQLERLRPPLLLASEGSL